LIVPLLLFLHHFFGLFGFGLEGHGDFHFGRIRLNRGAGFELSIGIKVLGEDVSGFRVVCLHKVTVNLLIFRHLFLFGGEFLRIAILCLKFFLRLLVLRVHLF
jgi:hypothetical protein